MSNKTPENTRFEDGDLFEVAVDGTPVAHYEEKSELSPEEDMAILLYMESIAETGREQFKENHGIEFSAAIEKLGPDMDMMIGDEEGWLDVDLNDL